MLEVIILYGSQTGNGEDVAMKLYRFLKNAPQYIMNTKFLKMNDFSFGELSDDNRYLIIFICSTTGQGDPPDNMKTFWLNIMKNSFKLNLIFLDFAVFGLGDSKYAQYNFIAKKLYRRLVQLGGNSILPLELADDQHPLGVDGSFYTWLEKLCKQIYNRLSHEISFEDFHESITKISNFIHYDVTFEHCQNNSITHYVPENFQLLTVMSNDRITSEDHFQDTRLVKFFKSDVNYNIGDVLVVYPINTSEDIDMFFTLTNIDRNLLISIRCVDLCFTLPDLITNGMATVNDLVKNCFDLNCVPRKSFFEALSFFSKHKFEKERLLELSSGNLDDLYSYCFIPRRSLIEVLRDFPNTTAELELSHWINIMPYIKPREYSIASSTYDVGEIHLLVSLVKYKTKMRDYRVGLCSNYLCNLKSDEQVVAKVKKGSLVFPIQSSSILISPGTGVSVARGFINDRINSGSMSSILLCFGCRYERKDFYFADEFKQYLEKGKLNLLTAFSREEGVYIYQKFATLSKLIWRIIVEENGYIFVCGRSTDMPQQVFDALKDVLKEEGNWSDEYAVKILNDMKKCKRYQLETWS